ncbi:NAD(P)H-quinone oxidoreductase subunit O [Synechococcales cyanobacterium C]|uniref:NAD(P)H-quinone oxidoreductase subunit O n=1 Tax=Petrachloros mirabilis ULC683 TaxID=2781853 RepID=A0A8K2A0W2_9CYAN|nr:NAD(P)H-quinone oxidoreductase subunit O [Petrachloros mirabilis]NCJ07553.1 NAD(P)H-quinone oxidoreductase subunit O [Petrachloros mirabilis ULC683]
MAIKKGDWVQLVLDKFEHSVEAQASDPRLPAYLFEGTGEVVELAGDYVQVKFRVPTPTVWLRMDQLEVAPKS